MKKIETEFGILYMELETEFGETRIMLYDSDRRFINHLAYLDLEDLFRVFESIRDMKEPYKLVDLGFGENMMYGSRQELYEELFDYCNCGDNELSKRDTELLMYDNMNRIGDNYFILNYTDL